MARLRGRQEVAHEKVSAWDAKAESRARARRGRSGQAARMAGCETAHKRMWLAGAATTGGAGLQGVRRALVLLQQLAWSQHRRRCRRWGTPTQTQPPAAAELTWCWRHRRCLRWSTPRQTWPQCRRPPPPGCPPAHRRACAPGAAPAGKARGSECSARVGMQKDRSVPSCSARMRTRRGTCGKQAALKFGLAAQLGWMAMWQGQQPPSMADVCRFTRQQGVGKRARLRRSDSMGVCLSSRPSRAVQYEEW